MQCKNVQRKIGSLPYYHNTNDDSERDTKTFSKHIHLNFLKILMEEVAISRIDKYVKIN